MSKDAPVAGLTAQSGIQPSAPTAALRRVWAMKTSFGDTYAIDEYLATCPGLEFRLEVSTSRRAATCHNMAYTWIK